MSQPGAPSAPSARSQSLDELRSTVYDLLVIGAGITGSRVAYEAARSGRRVALLDADDFGGATSSASSKLIHGGLRYLQMGQVGLVRAAHRERSALVTRVAPHLVRPLRFVLPVYRDGPYGAPLVAAGLFLYSALAGFRTSRARFIPMARARAMVPPLRLDGLRACGLFEDAQTHDSRLVLATVAAAHRSGATVLNHAPVTALNGSKKTLDSAEVRADGRQLQVRFRAVVNATGPWLDRVRRLEDPACGPSVLLSKGVHLTLPLPQAWDAALVVPLERTRVTFAIPWEGMLLLGTTDTPYDGEPDTVAADEADIATVLREASAALPAELLRREDVRCTYAGLRVLPTGRGDSARIPREHVVTIGSKRMVSVAGGKLTTHRLIATDVLRRLGVSIQPSDAPLPGAGPLPDSPTGLAPGVWTHLTHLYGSEVGQLLAYRARGPEALQPIHPDGPDVWAQAWHAVEHEWAVDVDDLVVRRTTLAVRGLGTPEVRARLSAVLRGSTA